MMCTAAGMASTGMASLPSPPKADLRKADLLASRTFVADMARLAEGLVMQVIVVVEYAEASRPFRAPYTCVWVVRDSASATRAARDMAVVCSRTCTSCNLPASSCYRTAYCRPPPTTYLPATYQDMHRAFWDFDATSSVASVQAGP